MGNVNPNNPYNANSQTPESATPVDHSGNADTADLPSVANAPTGQTDTPRVNQQHVLPSAIKGRLMQAVQDDNATILSGSGYVSDGSSIIALVTTTSNNGGMLLSKVYWQIYLNSVSAANRIPQAISSQFFPFYTWDSLYDTLNKPINTQPGKTVSAIQVRSTIGDASTHLIIIQAYIRMIINGSGQNTN